MKTIAGDILSIRFGIVLHQVNCVGATGGLAGALLRQSPEAFVEYRARCDKLGSLALGTALIARTQSGACIAHVFGQIQPGANTDLAAVGLALSNLAEQVSDDPFYSELPLFAPHLMGCGLGAGRWDQYLPLLEKQFPQLTLVKLPA